MARTPWATIKLCLPSWLVESAPHKQAFVLFLAVLFPSLLLSPFLLSPLLTLLLLSSATAAGALSVWITTKVTRTVLTHSSPLPLPLTLSSCFKSLVHIMRLKIFGSVVITNEFPWMWLWFVKILTSLETRDVTTEDKRGIPIDNLTGVGVHGDSLEQEDLSRVQAKSKQILKDSLAVEGEAVEMGVESGMLNTGVVEARRNEALPKPDYEKQMLNQVRRAAVEGKEKLSMLEFGRGGIGSVYFRGAMFGTKGLRTKKDESHFSVGLRVRSRDSEVPLSYAKAESRIGRRDKKSDSELIEVGDELKIVGKLQVLTGTSGTKEDAAQEGDHFVLRDQSGLRSLPTKVEVQMGAAKFTSKDGENVGPNWGSEEHRMSQGCASHSWCQKGLNFEEELSILVEDIHKLCLGKWYPSLSTNETFPSDLKILLGIFVKHAACIGARSDALALALKLGSLFLCHLREFRKARRKKRAAEAMAHTSREDEIRKLEHGISSESFASEENALSVSSGKSDSSAQSVEIRSSHSSPLIEPGSLVVQEDSTSSLLEKSSETVEQSYDKILGVSQTLESQSVSPSPKAHVHSALTKQKISKESHLEEELYYRLRFGHSRLIKDIPGHYLINVSMYIVREFISAVGKLTTDPSEKHYFRDCGSSLADSSPGKILISMVARKILLPLVETVSDPDWLNLRIATLLVDHAGAKVRLDLFDENKESLLFFTSGVHHVVNVEDCSSEGNPRSDDASFLPVKTERFEEISARSEESGSREERRKSLSLPLEMSGSGGANPIDGRISSVLGGIISATAGPLLPDNVGVSYKPIKRMWSSPSVEEGKELDGQPEYKKKVRSFGRNIVDGLPVESEAALEGAVTTSAQEVLCTTGDEELSGTRSLSDPKDLHGTSHRKARLSLSARKPRKKKFLGLPFGSQHSPGAFTRSDLFRSKSSHDVQAENEGIWHIEEGSELHEDAYLSDDPASPLTQEKETWEGSNRKPGRSHSFHGVKNYNRHREIDKDKQSRVLEGSEEIPKRENSGVHLKGEKAMLRVSSEGSMRVRSDKAFQEGLVELPEGLGARWMKYAMRKWDTQGSSEGESDELNRVGSSSCLSPVEKCDKGSVVSSGGSVSEGYVSPDVFQTENKFWSNEEGGGKVLTDKKDATEERHGSEIDQSEGKEAAVIYHSSPLPSVGTADDNVSEIAKDISPVYEEVEDLPSTIAKLKALLRERNGRQIGEGSSLEEVKKENESLSTGDFALNQDNVQIPKPPSSPLEERAFTWPSDGGIFLNVRIPYTEICKGASHSQASSTSPHVLYCIEYDAAYPEEGADAAVVSLASKDIDRSAVEGVGSHPDDREHNDGLTSSDNPDTLSSSPGTMVHHIIVKRRFQEFLDLHAQLEADPLWRQALKGLKGPSRWLSLPFGKTSASTVAGRRTLLQAYLRGVCTSMPQLASRSKALRTFMAYHGMAKPVASGETLPSSVERVLPITAEGGEGPVPRIDKLFARTVSGMFNTLKTALPGFDSPETTQLSSVAQTSSTSTSPLPPSLTSSHLDSSSAPAALEEAKAFSGYPGTFRGTMMQLPAFLHFGNSSTSTYPELVDWDMEYGERDSGGSVTAPGSIEGLPAKTYSLEEDVQTFLDSLANISEAIADPAEFAYEALSPFGIYEDCKDFEEHQLPSSSSKGLASQYMMDSIDEDGEEEELDAFLPLTKVAVDILCEALRGTGSWSSQGTVVHASKVLIGSFIEQKLQDFLETVTTKEMWCHYLHILRIALFHHPPSLCQSEVLSDETGSSSISGQQLAVAIYTAFPPLFRQIVGNQELSEAAKFIADSLQNKIILRELVLQVLHVCVVNLISIQSKTKEVN